MGIISPTLCHKCMQHASEWQEQWLLSLPSPGWRWGGASWEADRRTVSYSWARILQGGLPQPRQQAVALKHPDMGHVWIMCSDYSCFVKTLSAPRRPACNRGHADHTPRTAPDFMCLFLTFEGWTSRYCQMFHNKFNNLIVFMYVITKHCSGTWSILNHLKNAFLLLLKCLTEVSAFTNILKKIRIYFETFISCNILNNKIKKKWPLSWKTK